MPDRFGRISFPGLRTYDSFDYTVGQGIAPGLVSIIVPPECITEEFTGLGDLRVYDGVEEYTLRDCKLDRIDTLSSGSAKRYAMRLFDRRWRWQFVIACGFFNERDEKGKIKPHRKMGLHEMVSLLLGLLGEPLPRDLGNLPRPDDENLPVVRWLATNAAQALQSLVEPFGHRVVFDPISNRVRICEIGKGKPLPAGGHIERTPSYDLVESAPPILFGGPTSLTLAVVLEPVGREMDGTIRPIYELSYAPRFFSNTIIGLPDDGISPLTAAEQFNPWLYIQPQTLEAEHEASSRMGVRIPTTDEERQKRPGVDRRRRRIDDYRQLALSCVWKWFRPKLVNVFDGNPLTLDVPEASLENYAINNYDQIRFLPSLLSNEKNEAGETVSYRPRVYGKFETSVMRNVTLLENGAAFTEEGFTIDSERSLVMFDTPKYQKIDPATLQGWLDETNPFPILQYPYLILVTSVQVRLGKSNEFLRYLAVSDNDVRSVGEFPSMDYSYRNGEPIIREEVQLNVVQDYDVDDGFRPANVSSNVEECRAAAEHYFDGVERKRFMTRTGTPEVAETGTYPGIRAFSPDGLIRQVSWSLGGGSIAVTRIGSNTEFSSSTLSFEVTKRSTEVKELLFRAAGGVASPEQNKNIGGILKPGGG